MGKKKDGCGHKPAKKVRPKKRGAKFDDFVHLHTHTDHSQLDGMGRVSEYVAEAAFRHNPAIAFTDHGTMRGYVDQHKQCQKVGIKPIFGLEFYVSPNMRRRGLTPEEKADVTSGHAKGEHRRIIKEHEEREGIRDRWHTTVWAMNDEGLRNLYRLSTAAFVDGFYYKPRIDMAELIKYGEGLIVSTGCLSSPLHDMWAGGRKAAAMEWVDQLEEAFGDRLYYEVMPHAIADQVVANKLCTKLVDRYGRNNLVATQDAHYVNQADAPHHDVLLCIGTATNLSDPERFKFDGDEFHMRTRKQMIAAFRKHHQGMRSRHVKQAIDNTMVITDRIDAKLSLDYHAALLPDPGIPRKYKGKMFPYIKDLCLDGWTWRDIPHQAQKVAKERTKRYGIVHHTKDILVEYRERLKMELRALRSQQFVPYFAIIYDLYAWCRKAGIMVGPGRGSVAGSLVAYLLGLTAVDPIEHGLIFERFINPARIDMPDIDMDFEDIRRREVINYLIEKYGRDYVCQIATWGKLSGKACLKDVSRVLEVPYSEVNQVTNSIIERSSGDERASATIEDSFREFDVCKAFDQKYPDVLRHSKHLEGLIKQVGIHAAGVVASPVPLTDLMPLEVRKSGGEDIVVSASDYDGVASVGLVKLDVLGLRTLTVIRMCIDFIEEGHGHRVDMENLKQVPLDDPRVLKGFTDHDYGGVFQYDTPSADKVCSGVEFTSFEDVAAMTALNRPGTSRSGLATKYVERKKNPKLVEKIDFHPKVSEITADTLGIIVYQEHIIRIFTEIAGFPPGTSDSLRKDIAKKKGDESIGKERENFINGAVKNTPGMTREIAAKIMDAITFFGSYGFNKSHATAYGMIAYWCMWLKTYYPIEFYTALLRNEPDRVRLKSIAKDAKNKGIELLPPSVSASGVGFKIDREHNAIRGSLSDIKGCGTKASESVMEHQPFTNFRDFLERTDSRKVHKGVVVALAKAGALNDVLPNTRWLVENVEEFWKGYRGSAVRRAAAWEALDASSAEPDYSPEEATLVASSVSPLAFGRHPIDAYSDFLEEHVIYKIPAMGDDDYWKANHGKTVLIAGTIIFVKLNQVGDFHTGALPSAESRQRMYWGKRYANVNIEDGSDKQNRFKFDWDIYARERNNIELGVGAPLLVLASANAKYENMRARFSVNLEALRKKIVAGEELDIWERIITGKSPVAQIAKGKPAKVRRSIWENRKYRSADAGEKVYMYGVITGIRLKYDKKKNEMAWVGLVGGDGHFQEITVFGSMWSQLRGKVRPGMMVRVLVKKSKDSYSSSGFSAIFEGAIKRYKVES